MNENRIDLPENEDKALNEALGLFRQSVHAWSEAAYVRPRSVPAAARRGVAGRVAAWALGIALAAGLAGGGAWERHNQELARVAAQQAAEHQRQHAAEKALETEELLAQVDSDISRQVPASMEPLAQLMTDVLQ